MNSGPLKTAKTLDVIFTLVTKYTDHGSPPEKKNSK